MARPDAATIHAAVLGAILLGYVFVTWDAWFPERVEPLNFDRLGAVFLLIGVTGYAGVTTVAALLLRRRPLTVLLVHVLALAACAAALLRDGADRREFDAAAAREQEAVLQRERDVRAAEQCVRVAEFVVRPRPTLEADVTVSNGCPFRVVVSRVDLTGTDRGGRRPAGLFARHPGRARAGRHRDSHRHRVHPRGGAQRRRRVELAGRARARRAGAGRGVPRQRQRGRQGPLRAAAAGALAGDGVRLTARR
jgi:hypothetical protein